MERKVKKSNGQLNPAVRKIRRMMIPLIRDVTIRIVNRRFVERCSKLTGLPPVVIPKVPEELLKDSCKRAQRLLDFMTKKADNEKEVRSFAVDTLGYIPCLVDDNLGKMVTDQMIWTLISKAYYEVSALNHILKCQLCSLKSTNRIHELVKHLPCDGNYNGGDPNCLLCDDQQACSQERVNIAGVAFLKSGC